MDKDIIDTPLIDQNLDSYEQFFDRNWSKRMFEAVRTSPLNDVICTLLVAWRFTNGAHMLPWLMAQSLKRFAEAEPDGSLRFRSDYSNEIVKELVKKLDAQMQYSLNQDQRAKLKRVVTKIEKEAFQNLKAAQSKAVFPLAGYWDFLIHTHRSSSFRFSALSAATTVRCSSPTKISFLTLSEPRCRSTRRRRTRSKMPSPDTSHAAERLLLD